MKKTTKSHFEGEHFSSPICRKMFIKVQVSLSLLATISIALISKIV